jgi:alpha,alpha-trehalase
MGGPDPGSSTFQLIGWRSMSERRFRAVILDMDGVVTRTAHLHARAWKETFDPFLEELQEAEGRAYEPFHIEADYRGYVDGKPRYDGAASFLASRGIQIPRGTPDDDPGESTVCGLGNRKNERFQRLLEEEGAEAFPDAVEQIETWREAGLCLGLITSSRNGAAILEATGLTHLFDTRIDGVDAAQLEIPGKPAPDVFLEAARRLKVAPEEAVVVEDAVAGVEAGRDGGFGLVVGVARHGEGDLASAGAHQVVQDLREINLMVERRQADEGQGDLPRPAMDHLDEILDRMTSGHLALFLDYDGTLTPIVRRPEDALLSETMRDLLEGLAERATVAVVSGRDLMDVQEKVGLEDIQYAGSHGFDIAGPQGLRMRYEEAESSLPELDQAQEELEEKLAGVEGARVERKHFAIAVHYREVAADQVDQVEAAVDQVMDGLTTLRKKGGKKIFELQPDVEWDKGRAVDWLLKKLELTGPDVVPVYIGDDVTDEDAFEVIGNQGLGIRIAPADEPTFATYQLDDTDELADFLARLVQRLPPLEAPVGPEAPPRRREMYGWELIYRSWEPEEQPLREALCALGNGRLVTRGAFEEEDAGEPHYPGTYLAGGYNRMESEISGRIIENEDLVNWPNWLPLTFRVEGGEWFSLDSVEILKFEQRLHVGHGTLTRHLHFRDQGGREFELQSTRLVHMEMPHLAAQEWRLRPLNWSGTLEIRSGLDGRVINDNVARYRKLNQKHLEVTAQGWEGETGMYLAARTRQSRRRMAQAARTRLFLEDAPATARRLPREDAGSLAQHIFVDCQENRELRVEKVVSIRVDTDPAIAEPVLTAREDIRSAGSFAQLLRSHETRWRHLWSIFDIELRNGEVQTQLILRLHIFHLLQSVSPNTIDRDVGVPARGWHGEAYRGHIFWDEVFIFPLLALRIPQLARSLLMYRYRRLPKARELAAQEGFQGAMFPWQSGSDGREETQVLHLNPKSGRWLPDTTHLQRHVNAAIVFNLWTYWQVTADRDFLAYYGAEMILEIARFWASLARWDGERQRFVIEGVVGPDEFHTDDPHSQAPGLSNNAYTNVMASWCLRKAGEVLKLLDQERSEKLRDQMGLTDQEVAHWEEVSRKLLIPFHGDGIISQFEGYEDLEEFDWSGYKEKHGDIQRLDRILEAEGDDVNRYKASKQADVLMLLFLFTEEDLVALFRHMGYELTSEMLARNVDYYMERTSHGSTLSQIVHSWVLARSDRAKAWSFWQKALHSDIEDIQGGTTPEGIHLGAMAGTVDLIHRGHTGLVTSKDVLRFDPQLPEELADVRMRLRYRGHWLTVTVTRTELRISFDRGQSSAVKISVCGQEVEMTQGESRSFPIGSGAA